MHSKILSDISWQLPNDRDIIISEPLNAVIFRIMISILIFQHSGKQLSFSTFQFALLFIKETGLGHFNCFNYSKIHNRQFSSVQSLSHVQLFATPWTAARQASLSITNSQSLLKLMSIESVMPSNHLILSSIHPAFSFS